MNWLARICRRRQPKEFAAKMVMTPKWGWLIYETKCMLLVIRVTKLDGSQWLIHEVSAEVPYKPDPLYFKLWIPEDVQRVEILASGFHSNGEIINAVEDVPPGVYKFPYTFDVKKRGMLIPC